MLRAHRQAWCWQDEWYGLTIEDIRQLEHETQLMLAQKMAQFVAELNDNEAEQPGLTQTSIERDQNSISANPSINIESSSTNLNEYTDSLSERALTKQWSTSSKSSHSSIRGGTAHIFLHPFCLFIVVNQLTVSTRRLFPNSGHTGRQGGEEGEWHACHRWIGHQVQELAIHFTSV